MIIRARRCFRDVDVVIAGDGPEKRRRQGLACGGVGVAGVKIGSKWNRIQWALPQESPSKRSHVSDIHYRAKTDISLNGEAGIHYPWRSGVGIHSQHIDRKELAGGREQVGDRSEVDHW